MIRIAIPQTVEEDIVRYKAALQQLGAEPVRVESADGITETFDGLLLPGGVDIAPGRYGQQPAGSVNCRPELDALQLAALDAFIRARKPVFGICRGQQLVNVYFGGTLVQDIPNAAGHRRMEAEDQRHGTQAAAGCWLAELYGTCFATNSAHHQAVDALGEGLVVVQHADDGTIEGLCHAALPIRCVQWHPERMCFAYARDDTVDGSLVLRHFVEECTRCRK